ncbi:non-specific lipid-transfer protein-like protein At2g13820 isoform X2 [Arachis ipaensis]|uniref:non-specific lipid-transfer protein-like protein At2g13820 isoform X2 n=1 Tax=Arachis ipaensis TaxID=130454 RepID=UPI000A2B6E3B|nr:non-specific lipid-transfer protein-like protein At2g13820 isoform X2 [Arachis ipaensis]
MARSSLSLVIMVLVVGATMWNQEAKAQSSSSSSCTSTLTSLSPCLNYIMGSSSTPSSSCCSQLSSVVKSSPQCLCSVLNGGGSNLGIPINQTLALSLPSACKVQTPPVSQCKGKKIKMTDKRQQREYKANNLFGHGMNFVGVNGGASSGSPVGSPFGSPAESPADSPEGSIAPSYSVAGSKRVPGTNGGSSDGSNIKFPSHFLLSLVIVSCFSSITNL